ncbi:hypothetical protein [Pelagibius marinus]|uniref:hypothetical protein n=1 Tax=Pelagibius marinus TaxID=2762760 RepID=UPI001872FCC9|nr:hypothetical protein [Pelagibius marinus]
MSSERLFAPAAVSRGWPIMIAFATYVCAIVAAQLWFAVDPDNFHEEMRALFRFHPWSDPALFAGDYQASFLAAFPQPYLYEGVTRLWLWAGGDLVVLHRAFSVVCWLTLLLGMGLAARRLGNGITALGVVGLVAAQPLYLYQVTSAVPHAFGFPLLIWAVVAMLYGSLPGLVAVTLLSGLLYPALTPLAGLLLAWQVFVVRGFLSRGKREKLVSLLLLAATGALSLWLVFGALGGGSADFGAPLAPMQQVETYPENGPEGRHFYGVFNPLTYVAGKAVGQFRGAEVMVALAVMLLCGGVAAYGLLALPRGSQARRALVGFFLCSVALGLAVYLLRPFHSYRFVLYPLFTFLPLLTVVGLQCLCGRLERVLRRPEAAVLAGLALLVLPFDSFNAQKAGHRYHLGTPGQQVMAFAAARPADSVFAYWPTPVAELELIPYLAKRPAFVVRKVHYPVYDDYTLTMRARMNALIDAYLATQPAPLRALHCRWGVDFLVVEPTYFAEAGGRPEYFAPFDVRIARLWNSRRHGDFLLASLPPAAVVLDTGVYRIVDLSFFSGGDCAADPVD